MVHMQVPSVIFIISEPESVCLESAKHLRLGRRFTFQQDNTKYKGSVTMELVKANNAHVLGCPSHSPDLICGKT